VFQEVLNPVAEATALVENKKRKKGKKKKERVLLPA
jgi:hypothetical protein